MSEREGDTEGRERDREQGEVLQKEKQGENGVMTHLPTLRKPEEEEW